MLEVALKSIFKPVKLQNKMRFKRRYYTHAQFLYVYMWLFYRKAIPRRSTYKTHYVKRASLLLKIARQTSPERFSTILSTKHIP